MFSFMRQHRWVSVLILLNILAVIVVIGVIIHNSMKTATIDIDVAPSGATIELNGHDYDNFDSYDILPGNYHVKISMDGMQTKEFDLNLQSDGFAKIKTYLLDSDGGFGYYMTHPDEEAILAEIADDDASRAFVEKYNKIYSIGDLFPMEFSDSSNGEIISIYIDWSENECNGEKLCLMINDYTGENHELALQMIRDAGYNPDDYEIDFIKGMDYVETK